MYYYYKYIYIYIYHHTSIPSHGHDTNWVPGTVEPRAQVGEAAWGVPWR